MNPEASRRDDEPGASGPHSLADSQQSSEPCSTNDTLFQLPGDASQSPLRFGPLPTVPGYEILEGVGRGGMGVVYRARQTALGRLVAVKMLRSTSEPTHHELSRLRIEAEAIGRLQHPNIVQIYDVGEAAGRPYLAMEFVEGESLSARLKAGPLPVREAAQLVETLARAIHHAHTRGIVHRDLTPGNVLMQLANCKAQTDSVVTGGMQAAIPKITDFGLAKVLVGDSLEQTQTGAILGTPCYMAPEQAEGNVRLVGPRTDVYGLGAVLYAAITSKPPFQAETGWRTTRQVIEEAPAPLSKFTPGVPRDLETICQKCLCKEPHQRYGSAEDLADDLRRFLNHEPIVARRVGVGERLWLWARRNPATAATALVAALAVFLTAGIGLQQVLVERSRFRAERDRAEAHLYDSLVSDTRAQMKARDTGWWWTAMASLGRAANLHLPGRDPAELRDLAVECLSTEYPCFRLQGVWLGHHGMVTASAFSPDGRWAATGAVDKTVRIWSVPDGRCRAILAGHDERITDVAIHPNGRWLASAARDGNVRFWDIGALPADAQESKLTPLRTVELDVESIAAIEFAPDGKQLAAGCKGGSVYLIPAEGDAPPRRLSREKGDVLALAFQPGKNTLVIAAVQQPLRFRDLDSGQEVLTLKFGERVNTMAFSPEGTTVVGADPESWGFHIAAARADAPIAVFARLNNNSVVKVAHVGRVGHNATSQWLTASFDGALRLWATVPDGKIKEMAVARGDFGAVRTAAVAGNGPWVIAGHRDGAVRLWELAVPPERTVPYLVGSPGLAFLGPTRRLANPPTVSDFSQGMDATSVVHGPLGAGIVWAVAASPDGKLIATALHDGSIKIWDAQSLKLLHQLKGHEALAWCVAFSPDSKIVASGSGDVRLWDAATGRELRRLDVGDVLVRALVFHPRNGTLIAAAKDLRLRAWNVETGEPLGEPVPLESEIMGLAIRPDGGQLAGASFDEVVLLWDLPASRGEPWLPARPTHRITGHRTGVWTVAYSPDGRWLASGSEYGVMLTDVATRDRLVTLRGPEGQVRALSFSVDGELLAAALYTKPAVVWRLPGLRKTLAEMGLDW